MTSPTSLKFTDYEVPISALTWNARQSLAPASWTRVKFNVPDNDGEATTKICEWLISNCVSNWRESHYPDPRSKNLETTMVVKFESRDDALMFKLRGGHQAWQQDS